jgi:hypothetical protein
MTTISIMLSFVDAEMLCYIIALLSVIIPVIVTVVSPIISYILKCKNVPN